MRHVNVSRSQVGPGWTGECNLRGDIAKLENTCVGDHNILIVILILTLIVLGDF